MVRRARPLLRKSVASEWLAVLACSALVLLAGGRLVVLSLQRHAVQARTATAALAERAAQALQGQLQSLLSDAQRRAASAAATAPAVPSATWLLSLPPARNAFWLTADGHLLSALTADREAVKEIAAEWDMPPPSPPNTAASSASSAPASSAPVSSAPAARDAGSSLLGPLRQGSRWLIAMRAPLHLAGDNGSAVAWVVVYRDLDSLLVAAQLDRATRQGYDFELSRPDPGTQHQQLITGSTDTPLAAPITSAIRLPGVIAADSSDVWQLAMRPKAGWFPADELIVDVSLLILVTWLVALGIRDVTHHMDQLRAALTVSRRRLRSAQQKLTNEVDQRLRLQESFEHARYHDSFTGLPNRHYFLSQLDRGLREMRTRSGYRIAVLLIAVDRFKVVTDTLGRTAGDELMLQVTRLFDQALSSQQHVLARWGDDELALLLSDVPNPAAVLEAARTLQQVLQVPIELRRHRVVVATSIGTTCIESGLQRAEEVLREADIALYSAKTPGSANLVAYNPAMQNQLMHLVSLEGDLHAALEREEFRLLFQPIVDLRARRIVGVEVLLRWQHPIEGLLAPGRFLGFAEETGLIVPITRWIILRACRLGAQWRQRLPVGQHFYTSINLSPAALLDPGLADYVAQVLRQTATPASALKFELTENGLINNVGAARAALDRLHAMGIELMLDDFGTGYSSLSHLQLFPFDYIKIDGPMDGPLSSDRSIGALIRAMAQMASTLGLKSIAEVVETTAAADALEEIGCQFAQGNVFCAPVNAEQAVKRLLTNLLGSTDVPQEPPDSPTLILPELPEHMAP